MMPADQSGESLPIDFAKQGGLVPAVIQDAGSGDVLMVAYMNEEALRRTIETGLTWFYSRSRKALWQKGEESGHVQRVRDILVDCDTDTIVVKVEQVGGAACHEGYRSCFFRRLDGGLKNVAERVFDPRDVYGKKN